MDYKNKYLKYKIKYLQLKQHNKSIKNKLQIGGTDISTIVRQLSIIDADNQAKWFTDENHESSNDLIVDPDGIFKQHTVKNIKYKLTGPIICIAYPHPSNNNYEKMFSDEIFGYKIDDKYTLTSIVLFQNAHYISLCKFKNKWHIFNDITYPDEPEVYTPDSLKQWIVRILMYSENNNSVDTLDRPIVNVPNCNNMCFINSVLHALIASYGYNNLIQTLTIRSTNLKDVDEKKLVHTTLEYIKSINQIYSDNQSPGAYTCITSQKDLRKYCNDNHTMNDYMLGDPLDFLTGFNELILLSNGFSFKEESKIVYLNIDTLLNYYDNNVILNKIENDIVMVINNNSSKYDPKKIEQYRLGLDKIKKELSIENTINAQSLLNQINNLKINPKSLQPPESSNNNNNNSNNILNTIYYGIGGGFIIGLIIAIIIKSNK